MQRGERLQTSKLIKMTRNKISDSKGAPKVRKWPQRQI